MCDIWKISACYINNVDFGYESRIKATYGMLEKLKVENRVHTRITGGKRIEIQDWNERALREAVINAIVHNDYSYENTPQIEIFDDRIEITSVGGLPYGMGEEEFLMVAQIHGIESLCEFLMT